ncbi:MAG: cation-translocating P-type ATPase [Clostridia bacterium]|nr:cation-translocating P-type ATPase [Clostridia bacterium]
MDSCCSVKTAKEPFFQTLKYQIVSLSISLVCLALSFFWQDIVGRHSIAYYLNIGWIGVILCSIPLVYTAFYNLFKLGKIKSSLLITVAIIACIALEILDWCGVSVADAHSHGNYIFTAGEVAFLMMIGGMLEDITVRKSKAGIEKLVNLAPKTAWVNINGEYVSLPVSLVRIDDTVLVKPYEQVSVDGVVSTGNSAVNTSAITGESLPTDVTVGDNVYAGTWNQSGAIEIVVTRASNQTTLSKMVQLVKQAENNRAPIASTADKWASIIVPSAVTIAVIVFFVTLLGFKVGWQEALVRGVTVLVVFCPCALALATPTAIAAAIGNATKRGIIIKSGLALQTLSAVDTVVFDKTGTLTKNDVTVVDYVTSIDDKHFAMYVGSVEKTSTHPLAQALVRWAENKSPSISSTDMNTLIGVGVSATIEDRHVVVAKYTHFGVSFAPNFLAKCSSWLNDGRTVVGVSVDDNIVGWIALGDTLKEGALQCINQLHLAGIRTVMLTGDNQFSAKMIALQLGIEEYQHSLLPEQKLLAVQQLKQSHKVCMVGDGVNDAPSLATADCSMAMGVMGTDVALQIADIALMADRIDKIPDLITFTRRVHRTIIRNMCISMAINLIAVILSLFGLLTPILGAVVHNLSSLFVVITSALLLTVKEKQY